MNARRAAEAAAWHDLDQALLAADERGQQIPCRGHWASFTADDTETCRRAARACATCPVLDTCAGVVPFVWHGAWAGRVISFGKVQKEVDS
ncbi:hypothetical protein [Flexivirga oryzae]|uniref:4Fe-4S Wbl-type domain-containing protein n=1 Tax=Flexivirga oryzae TaxID=1794944 RepID=A0A839NIU6_9MICO|nr:hypothetical protein [Flexivirga oryzae]MBB2894571.1 hypothetical protein [Flexivirga oryzae]